MSRQNILNRIKKNKPEFKALPELDFSQFKVDSNKINDFIKNSELGGSAVIREKSFEQIKFKIHNLFPDAKEFFSSIEHINLNTFNIEKISSVKELDNLDAAIIEAQFGVGENGAVWLSDKNFPLRIIPFITSHLIIILNENDIVENMHDAFLKLEKFNEGYGIFISGPSKTADIEQSLVIGAQAALSMTIFLV